MKLIGVATAVLALAAGLAFAEILVLDVAVLGTMVMFWRVKRLAGALLVPYALWAGFATVLNHTIWRLNT